MVSKADSAAFDRWAENTGKTMRMLQGGHSNVAVECKPCGATIEAHEHVCSYCKTPRTR
jgi:ribosomal protein L32